MASSEWIVFLTQLPSPTSSLRVSVWRRMKSAGAVGLQNGAWLLPSSPKNRQFAEQSVDLIQAEGGSATVFIASAFDEGEDARLIATFRANVGQEYAEFCERCEAFTGEVKRESDQRKFTFAELDENEEELQKLTSWHRKIRARDFFSSDASTAAGRALEECRHALEAFEKAVYRSEGLSEEKKGN